MALLDLLPSTLNQYPPSTLLLTLLLLTTLHLLYKITTDPLKSIPGPIICRFTPLWTWYHSYLGDECRQIQRLHRLYGPVVRIGPRDVVISDGEALAPIYSDKGGFLKAPCYKSFDSEGHETIFSTLDPARRSVRSRAVGPMFSMGNLREGRDVLEGCVGRFVGRLKAERERCMGERERGEVVRPVDVLNLSRSLAIDAVCAYLFGGDYGGLAEVKGALSATKYVDSIVQLGRFFFLPPWLFQLVIMVYTWFQPTDPDLDESAEKVHRFTTPLVETSQEQDNTYQSRLLHAGITPHETSVQMKDAIFAGTDTTGMNLSIILWNLAHHPSCYRKLRQEILEAERHDPSYNPQSLPYLTAVLHEGLRLSLANPTRFPRQVPPQGFTYAATDGTSYHLPPGTLVGVQPYTLHFNPVVFPDPETFRPERWERATPEMQRDWMPFGIGARRCIARNLAMVELGLAVRGVVREGVLEGVRGVGDRVVVREWFNAVVVGGKVEISW